MSVSVLFLLLAAAAKTKTKTKTKTKADECKHARGIGVKRAACMDVGTGKEQALGDAEGGKAVTKYTGWGGRTSQWVRTGTMAPGRGAGEGRLDSGAHAQARRWADELCRKRGRDWARRRNGSHGFGGVEQ